MSFGCKARAIHAILCRTCRTSCLTWSKPYSNCSTAIRHLWVGSMQSWTRRRCARRRLCRLDELRAMAATSTLYDTTLPTPTPMPTTSSVPPTPINPVFGCVRRPTSSNSDAHGVDVCCGQCSAPLHCANAKALVCAMTNELKWDECVRETETSGARAQRMCRVVINVIYSQQFGLK